MKKLLIMFFFLVFLAPTVFARTYITGPRNGCYYINSNGNKTYTTHFKCGSSATPPSYLQNYEKPYVSKNPDWGQIKEETKKSNNLFRLKLAEKRKNLNKRRLMLRKSIKEKDNSTKNKTNNEKVEIKKLSYRKFSRRSFRTTKRSKRKISEIVSQKRISRRRHPKGNKYNFIEQKKAERAAEKIRREAAFKKKQELENRQKEQASALRIIKNKRNMIHRSFYEQPIREDCLKKWDDDSSMIQYCINSQLESVKSIQSNGHQGLSENEDLLIFERCYYKWDTDFSMINYCMENQQKSLKNIKKMRNNEFKRSCEIKWGNDFSMVEYCIEN